jgi:hypothetical protein
VQQLKQQLESTREDYARSKAKLREEMSAANEGRQTWQEEKDRVCALLLEQYRKDKKNAVESLSKQWSVQLRKQHCMAVEDRTASMVRLKAVLLVALDAKIAEMEDDMFDRLALSESKGQKLLQESVQNAKADAQGDIRDAVSKKDSEWKKAAEEVRKLHGAELEKVQAFAEQGIKVAEGKMEAAVRLEKMQGEERQKHAVSLAVEASEAIANARIADTATAHTKELTRMVANMRQERAQWLSERDRIRQQASEAKDKAVAEAVAAVQTMADIALRNQKEEAASKLRDAIHQTRNEAAQEQEEAVRALQEESEKIISRIEEAMENLNAEKENLIFNDF